MIDLNQMAIAVFNKLMCILGFHKYTESISYMNDTITSGRLDAHSYEISTIKNCSICDHEEHSVSSIRFTQKALIMPMKEYDADLTDQIKENLLNGKAVKEIVELTKVSETTVRRRIKEIEATPSYRRAVKERSLV